MVYGYLSARYEWELWGSIVFFAGLFIGVIGIAVPEEKTKTVWKALGVSLLVMMFFMGITWSLYEFVWRPYPPIVISISGLLFFFVLVTIIAYFLFDLVEKRKLSAGLRK